MNKRITGFSLLEFLQQAQDSIQQGYVFNFEDNDSVPQKFGNIYEAEMVFAPVAVAVSAPDAEQEEVVEVVPEVTPEPTPEIVTRKKKGA